jgi:hypothetical protein
MDEGASRNGASPSEEAHCEGPQGRGPFLGILEDMFRLRIRASFSMETPLRARETWHQEGESYTGYYE